MINNKSDYLNTIISANKLLKILQDIIINKIVNKRHRLDKITALDLYRELNNSLISLETELLLNNNNINFKYNQVLNTINFIKTTFKDKRVKIS